MTDDDLYVHKPEVIWAKFWDGSRKSWLEIQEWMPRHLKSEPHCKYWELYDSEPPSRRDNSNVRLFMQHLAWSHRCITFDAWGRTREMHPWQWVFFRYDDTAEHPQPPEGGILSPKDFHAQYVSPFDIIVPSSQES